MTTTQTLTTDEARLVSEYERIARANRPDWDQFINDAEDDVFGIAYEMSETADDLSIALSMDRINDIAQAWVGSLHRKPIGYEARCTKCGESFCPADENDLEHWQRADETPCGGTGEMVGSWG